MRHHCSYLVRLEDEERLKEGEEHVQQDDDDVERTETEKGLLSVLEVLRETKSVLDEATRTETCNSVNVLFYKHK